MLTLNSAATMLNVLTGQSEQPLSRNEDVLVHLMSLPTEPPEPFALRLLPGFVRRPLKARAAARAQDRMMVRLWETSPHLLDDVGVVLSEGAALPDHLVAAPAGVIAHVAARAPEQIVAAEMAWPPVAPAAAAAAAAAKTARSQSGETAFGMARAI